MTKKEYNECVDNYADGLYRFMLSSIKDMERAKDLVQDAFEKLWRKHVEVESGKSKSFLFTAAYNAMIDMLRKEKRIGQMSSELMVAELTTANPDTVIVNIGHKDKVIVLERDAKGKTREIVYYKKGNLKNRLSHWNILFDLGFSNYSDKNHFTGSKDRTGIDYPDLHTSKSVNVALYPIFRTFRIIKNNLLNIQTGLGFDWGNYRFEDGWSIARENGIIVSSGKYRPNGESSLSKSKLTTVYLNVPLLLKLNIPVSGSSRKHFYLSAGIIGGLKIGSHTKIKYYDSGKKEKDRSSFNLNLLRYDLTFRAGYRWIGFYFNYQMTPMFENGKAHRLFPYSVGLSFKIL